MEPNEVAQGALAALGKELFFIPGVGNQLLGTVSYRLSMEIRSHLLRAFWKQPLSQSVEESGKA
jgi:hypothetical protein